MPSDNRLSARFGSDTSDLKNGLAEITRELKVVNSSFQASASVLGDWSSTSDGLNLRISALNKSIDLQKEKVNALQVAYEQQVAAHGAGSAAAQNMEVRLNNETAILGKMQVELKDTTGALQKMGSQTNQTGSQVQRAGANFKSFGDIVKSVTAIIKNATIIAAAAAVALKQAWNFAEEGAKLIQLQESYDGLIERLGASSDVMGRLSAATHGTIDDDDLMAATLKMLTGTSNDLSRSLLQNAPALMEIAKAANKLNPTLGDTLSLYEQISESIKNLTPRGLKQAGIVIDTADAYEKYADSMGKAKDALTEEEQSQALLNAVLEKGQTILQQVGGNTESASDRFERANLAIDNLKESIELGLVPVMGDLANAINLALTGGQGTDIEGTAEMWQKFFDQEAKGAQSAIDFGVAYTEQRKAIYDALNERFSLFEKAGAGARILLQGEEGLIRKDTEARQIILQLSGSYEEYIKAADKAGLTARIVSKDNQLLTQTEFEQYKALQELIKTVDFASMSYEDFLKLIEGITGANTNAEESTGFLSDAIIEMAKNLYDATHQSEEFIDASEKQAESLKDSRNLTRDYTDDLKAAAEAQRELNAAEMSRVQAGISGQLKQAVGSYQQSMGDLAKKRLELEGKMKELGATDFLPALDVKKIAQYQSQLTGLWVSVHDLNMKRKEGEELNDEEQANWDATMDKVGALKNKIEDLGGVPYLTSNQRKELEDLRKEYADCDDEAKKLQDALRQATNEMIFQRAAAGLDAQATLELGRALGVISEEDYAVATVLDGLNKATASTDPGAYAAQVKAIADAIDLLHDKGITVTVTTIQEEIIKSSGTEHRTPTTPTGRPRYASGGSGRVPPGYPDDSYPVWMTSGEEFAVTPPGSPGIATILTRVQQDLNAVITGMNVASNVNVAGAGGAGAIAGAGITFTGDIIVNGAPGMDEELLAQKVVDKIGDTLEVARSKGLR